MTRLRALVTNDDGVSSDGLCWLASTAIDLDLDVVVAAPAHDASGSSAALTAVQSDGRIVVEKQVLPGLEGIPVYGVAAAPGFIALIATRGAFGAPPEIVLSGINLGANTGNAVLHSGTVGAAMTARVHGCRAMAVSLAVGDGPHWETAAAVTRQALTWLLDVDDPVVLNVNVPDVAEHELRGVRRATLAPFGAVQTTIAEAGQGFVRLGVADVHREPEPGSDDALVAQQYATVTALNPLCVDAEAELPFEPALASGLA